MTNPELRGSHTPLASIIVVGYRSLPHLKECFESIALQTHEAFEIVFVSNSPDTEDEDFVRTNYPAVRVVHNGNNGGYCGGNNVGCAHAKGDYLIVLNPDTRVDKNWLRELVAYARQNPQVGIVTPQILFHNDPAAINTMGNDVHVAGLVFPRYYGAKRQRNGFPSRVAAPSGCCFLIPRRVVAEVGLFSEEFFQELGDADLAIRCYLHGYSCAAVDSSVVFHKYRYKMSPARFAELERGRYSLLLRNFHASTLFSLAPVLILAEALTWGFALVTSRQYVSSKVLSYSWALRHVKDMRKSSRNLRRFPKGKDRAIIKEIFTTAVTLPDPSMSHLKLCAGRVFSSLFLLFSKSV